MRAMQNLSFVLVPGHPEQAEQGGPGIAGEDSPAGAEQPPHGVVFVPAPTVSIGVASFPESGSTAGELLEAADMALYAAKQSGKNQVAAG